MNNTIENKKEYQVSIFDVARSVLEESGGELTSMKLQKLCYYIQAWYIAWYEVPLFNEDFQAWRNGPVCRELYDMYSGRYLISLEDLESFYEQTDREFLNLADKQRDAINTVMEHYGVLSGSELSKKTHEELPWIETRKGLEDRQNSEKIIEKDIIGNYYRERLDNEG